MHSTGRLRSSIVVALATAALLGACAMPPSGGGGGGGTIQYVALGDSFSSGEGAPPYDDSSSCRRSPLGWPRLLAADGLEIASLDHRACSNDDLSELTGQLPAAADGSVDLVTLTTGGNDAGFGDLLRDCLLGACPAPTDPTFQAALASIAAQLPAVYTAVAAKYPNADIVHVGYPRLLPPPGDPHLCFWLDAADQTNASGLVDALNLTLKTAALAASVAFADIPNALADHELCTLDPWLVSPPALQSIGHPNAAGQRAIERAVAPTLGITIG